MLCNIVNKMKANPIIIIVNGMCVVGTQNVDSKS